MICDPEKTLSYTTAEFEAMTDEQLVALAKIADCGASDELYRRYKNFVRSKAHPYFLMGGDREDIVQEGMIGFFKAIRDYDPEKNSSFRPFADMCIVRQLITAIKSAASNKHMPLNQYESLYKSVYEEDSEKRLMDVISSGPSQNPEDMFIRLEDARIIETTLETALSDFERDVLRLYIKGVKYNDIALELQRSSKAVDNALQRIKKKLHKALLEGQAR